MVLADRQHRPVAGAGEDVKYGRFHQSELIRANRRERSGGAGSSSGSAVGGAAVRSSPRRTRSSSSARRCARTFVWSDRRETAAEKCRSSSRTNANATKNSALGG